MNTNWFTGCATAEAIKAKYRELCKKYHPDMPGGDTRTMQEINAAYAIASDKAKRQEKPDWNEQQYRDAAVVDEAIREAIEKIIRLAGLQIEICGLWVWVSGDTKTHKEALKAAGYQWAPKKMKWYYAGIPANGRGRMSMDEIRWRYGSQKVQRPDDDDQRQAPRRPAGAFGY